MSSYCVIGSGISGATIANLLSKKNSVDLFDKARGPGGRASFKRLDKIRGFDHGTQYISPKSAPFKKFIKELIKKKILKNWSGRHLFLNSKKKEKKNHIKIIGKKGNNDISKYLLKDINYNLNSELINIKRVKDFWILTFKDKTKINSKNLILTAPLPQTMKLCKRYLKNNLFNDKIQINSNLTVLLTTNKVSNRFSSLFTNDKDLGWISLENSKKRFKYFRDLWVLQSTFDFGNKNIDFYKDKKNFYISLLIKKFKKITGIKFDKIYFKYIHGWKYSSISKPFKVKSYWNKKIGLGICADWFIGPRLENGWQSAHNLHKKIIK